MKAANIEFSFVFIVENSYKRGIDERIHGMSMSSYPKFRNRFKGQTSEMEP